MSVFSKSMEIKQATEPLRDEIKRLEWSLHKLQDVHAFDTEKAVDHVRKEMQKSLIESDLLRVEAVAKLNTYIDMDTKDERKHIQKMLDKAIDALGKQKVEVLTSK